MHTYVHMNHVVESHTGHTLVYVVLHREFSISEILKGLVPRVDKTLGLRLKYCGRYFPELSGAGNL
jgi:hypothetical protein